MVSQVQLHFCPADMLNEGDENHTKIMCDNPQQPSKDM